MNTNSTNQTHDTSATASNQNWYRRTLTPVGVAAGVALALALSACGTQQTGGSPTAADATTTSVLAAELSSPAVVSTASSAQQASPSRPVDLTPANTNESGQHTSPGNTGNPNNNQPAPLIDDFTTPENIDCHNGNFKNFNASWKTTNATKVTISIDGPGVYQEYPANGETSLPFNCSSSHRFLLAAYGPNGAKATRTITLDPRNVQVPPSDDDEEPMGVTAKTAGGSTGTGPASQHDCDVYAQQIDGYIDEGVKSLNEGDFDAVEAAGASSDRMENEGLSAGCFFVYT